MPTPESARLIADALTVRFRDGRSEDEIVRLELAYVRLLHLSPEAGRVMRWLVQGVRLGLGCAPQPLTAGEKTAALTFEQAAAFDLSDRTQQLRWLSAIKHGDFRPALRAMDLHGAELLETAARAWLATVGR